MKQVTETHDAWLTPGRRVLEGYLSVSRGARKRRGTLFEMDAIEASGHPLPRYLDCHAVWFDKDPAAPPGHQLQRPFLRYKATRPIPGLRSECDGHRVWLTCFVGERWANGLGAYITRATGECISCREVEAGLENGSSR